jgi:hypothetical protein
LLVGGEEGEAFETKLEARPIAFVRHVGGASALGMPRQTTVYRG